jgi:hypothetical protein
LNTNGADSPKVIFVGFENHIAKIIGANDLNRGYSFPIPRFVYFGDHFLDFGKSSHIAK